jgi:hypothetical protein
MAQAQRETRLPCQRCICRLARGRELDRLEILTCDKQAGHVLCDYCATKRHGCHDVCFLPARRALLTCVSDP